LDQANTAAWSGSATALEVRLNSVATAGDLVFWPQTTGTPAGITATTATLSPSDASGYTNWLSALTADPLLTSGIVSIQNYDLPDLSTLYAGSVSTAAAQADLTTAQLAVTSVANQFVTDTSIAAVTDFLFSQPMRRYSVAVNYKSTSATAPATGVVTAYPLNTSGTVPSAIYRGAAAATTGSTAGTLKTDTAATAARLGTGSNYYASSNLTLNANGSLCLSGIAQPGRNTLFDREETTPPASSGSFVISPGTPTTATNVPICGEAAVLSINNGGTTGASALNSSLSRTDVTSTSLTAYVNGWAYFATPAAVPASASGLPIIGQSFMRLANGRTNYGISYTNKVTRP
jgi:hypothetical protein